MKLTAENVVSTFMECLFKPEEDTTEHVAAHGVMAHIGFHPGRLEAAKPNILAMIQCLPPQFHKDLGGGWSFLQMIEDKDGKQWADMHETVDQLLTLGLAIGKLSFTMPREFWNSLPGGMPYIVIN